MYTKHLCKKQAYNIIINCKFNLNKKTMEQVVAINLTGNWIAQALRKYCKHLVSVLRKTAGHLGFVYLPQKLGGLKCMIEVII